MKKLFPVLIILFVIPQVAMAAWWNPASWFKQKAPVLGEEEIAEELTDSQATPTASEVIEPKQERVITVTYPNLQGQINTLIRENAELRATINLQSSLAQQLNQCKLELSNFKIPVVNSGESSEYQDRKEKLVQLDDELFALIEEMVDGADKYLSIGELRSIRDRTNEIFIAYKYIDPKFNIKDIPDYLDFMSEGGQISKKIETARISFRETYLELKKDLDWYIKYR